MGNICSSTIQNRNIQISLQSDHNNEIIQQDEQQEQELDLDQYLIMNSPPKQNPLVQIPRKNSLEDSVVECNEDWNQKQDKQQKPIPSIKKIQMKEKKEEELASHQSQKSILKKKLTKSDSKKSLFNKKKKKVQFAKT